MIALDLAFRLTPILLPEPTMPGGTLRDALQMRRSTRDFRPDALTASQAATLLWSAAGVNRQANGGRTAPTAHDNREIDVFVVTPQGAWLYDAPGHALLPVAPGDLRASTGEQAFVADAPLDLVYVADFARAPEATPQQCEFLSAVGAGAMAQNVFLAAAAMKLGCVVRALIDRRRLAAALSLAPSQRILIAQTIGYPRTA
ncbi:MAG: nitroreductase family protein [Vitreoscilla sp.]